MTDTNIQPDISTSTYIRKPFSVEAVQVTDENMEVLAQHYGGEIQTFKDRNFIRVRVIRPYIDRQTRAYSGDWLLVSDTEIKVYTEKAFAKAFVPEIESDIPAS